MTMLTLLLFLQLRAVDTGPIPMITRSFPSEKLPDAAIENALQDRETFRRGDWYFYNRVDLSGDGEPELLVQTNGRWVCGNSGCPLFVLKRDGDKLVLVTEISLSDAPVIVSSKRTHGWNDLILWQRSYAWDPKNSIGQPSHYVVLRFNGQTYPANPSIEPSKPLLDRVKGVAYMVNPEKHEFGIPIKR